MTTDSNVDQADSSTEDSASPSTCGPAETARRAPRVGSACLLNDRLFHVVDIGAGFRITLRDAETGQLSEAPLDDLVCLRAAGEGESTASEGAQALKRLTAVRQLSAVIQ